MAGSDNVGRGMGEETEELLDEEWPEDRRRRQGPSQKAIFIGVAILVTLAALASHQYFTSERMQAKRIYDEAREHPVAQKLESEGCVSAFVFTPAQVALLVHLGSSTSHFPGGESKTHQVLCQGGQGASQSSCKQVMQAYRKAGGEEPAFVAVMDGNGNRVCMDFSLLPTAAP